MNRPWTACAVMLITLGGTLLAVGSANQPPCDCARQQSVHCHREVVFCEAPLPADFCYENGCGYDRMTGERHSPPAVRQVWSMVAEQRFATTMALLRSLSPRDEVVDWSTNDHWSSSLEILHPSSPSFYNDQAARAYAVAQGKAWRESSQPLMLRTVATEEQAPVVRLELCPSKTPLSWGFGDAASYLSALVHTVQRYPAEHNLRITVLAIENRSRCWTEAYLPSDVPPSRSLTQKGYSQSAQAVGLDASDYEELVDRAMEKLPTPEKTETPPHFRPAPSRQKLLRMASATLQRMSELLDATATRLESAAAGEVATRNKRPGTR